MNNLYKSKDYAWSLFVGHLVIEKLLKASFIKAKREHPPLIHNLLKISDLAGIKYSKEEEKLIDVITSFNLGSRYDDYKKKFYKKCTKSFTEEWLKEIKRLRKWIKEKHLV